MSRCFSLTGECILCICAPMDWFIPSCSFRNVVKAVATESSENIYIGRSQVAMWIRVISSWICMLLYMWSLLAPALLPDR